MTKRLIKRKVIDGVLKTGKELHRELVELSYDISYQSAINELRSMEFHSSIKKKEVVSGKSTYAASELDCRRLEASRVLW